MPSKRQHTIIEKVHDDGDLTVRRGKDLYVITTDHKVFRQVKQRRSSRPKFGRG